MANLRWLHTSGWWKSRLLGHCRAARCPVWLLLAVSTPMQIDAGPNERALWSARCRPAESSGAGATGQTGWGIKKIMAEEHTITQVNTKSDNSFPNGTCWWHWIALSSYLIWNPRAVCKLVPVRDSDDHRWFQEEWVTSLREEKCSHSILI